MILVVADASPLNYLVRIGHQHLLRTLYGRVIVQAVISELTHPHAPFLACEWARNPPPWVEIRSVSLPSLLDPALAALGPGEREAIQLAQALDADLILMDEKAGTRIARQKGLAVTGILGVLIQAARQGLIEINEALQALEKTDFRCTPKLFDLVKRLSK